MYWKMRLHRYPTTDTAQSPHEICKIKKNQIEKGATSIWSVAPRQLLLLPKPCAVLFSGKHQI